VWQKALQNKHSNKPPIITDGVKVKTTIAVAVVAEIECYAEMYGNSYLLYF